MTEIPNHFVIPTPFDFAQGTLCGGIPWVYVVQRDPSRRIGGLGMILLFCNARYSKSLERGLKAF